MENFNSISHKKEIINSREGGFGGSDARMVMEMADRIAQGQPLTTTHRHRLLQLKGLETPKEFSTPEMEAGHAFESEVANSIPKEWRREYKLVDGDPSRYDNFRVFAHADFYEPVSSTVKECKWSRKLTADGLLDRYRWQLQWYYMLGVTSVSLCYDTEDGNGCVDVPRDADTIDDLRDALRIIDDAWDTLDLDITERTEDEVAPAIAKQLQDLRVLEQQKSILQAQIDEIRALVGKYMDETETVKISGSFGVVSYTMPSESVQFDSRKFAKDYADLYTAYRTKLVKKAGYISCKFNEQ